MRECSLIGNCTTASCQHASIVVVDSSALEIITTMSEVSAVPLGTYDILHHVVRPPASPMALEECYKGVARARNVDQHASICYGLTWL